MTAGFPELIIGGVLVSPFVAQAVVAFGLLLACRLLIRWLRIERFAADPPLVAVCVYVVILASTMLIHP